MKLKTEDLKTERQWRAATGFDQKRFEKLLELFTVSYLKLFGKTVAERQAEIETTPSLTTERELLLFTLFSLKAGLTYDLLGIVSGMDGSNAKRNQDLGLKVLEQALGEAGCLPKREFKNAAEFAEYLKKEKTLIFDGVEQRTQRPGDEEEQKMNYSGKKRPHGQGDYLEQLGPNGVVCELLLGRENARLRDVQTGISTSPGLVQGISSQSGSWVSGNR